MQQLEAAVKLPVFFFEKEKHPITHPVGRKRLKQEVLVREGIISPQGKFPPCSRACKECGQVIPA